MCEGNERGCADNPEFHTEPWEFIGASGAGRVPLGVALGRLGTIVEQMNNRGVSQLDTVGIGVANVGLVGRELEPQGV